MKSKCIFCFISIFVLFWTGCSKTQSPGPTPDPENISAQPAPIAKEPPLDDNPTQTQSGFEGAVFVGDSISLKLKLYAAAKRHAEPNFLDDAQFLCSGSFGNANALLPVSAESVHPLYKGEKLPIEDSISQMKAKKVYIMLGANDIGLYGIDDSIKNAAELINKIKQKSPGIQICVQSVTPMLESCQLKNLNNPNIENYNAELKNLCDKENYKFIDVASVLKDEKGNLKEEYCGDPSGVGIHFTNAACEKWVEVLQKT